MDILSRLIQFRNYTQLSNSQFADLAKIPRPTLSQFLTGRNKRLSDELAAKLHVAFPNLNMMWLLFGEGNMLINPNIEISADKFGKITKESPTLSPENESVGVYKSLFSDIHKNDTITENNSKTGANIDFNELTPKIEKKNNTTKTVKFVMVVYSDFSQEIFIPST